MAIEEIIARSLSKILDKKQEIFLETENWTISNFNSNYLITCTYKEVTHYSFKIINTNEIIKFENYHRKAKKGTGTESLKQLESSFKLLSKLKSKNVEVLFDTYKQKDTKKWLIKNNYRLNKQGIYVKTFQTI